MGLAGTSMAVRGHAKERDRAAELDDVTSGNGLGDGR